MYNNTDIYYFYSNECGTLTEKIKNFISKSKSMSNFYFIDVNDSNNLEYLDKFNPTSYPQFFIVRNEQCIETIFGTYTNILNILEYYI